MTDTTLTPTRVIDENVSIHLTSGAVITGRLEHMPGAKVLAVFDDNRLDGPAVLTVRESEARAEHSELADDEVLIRNWTNMRGVGDALVQLGIVELTGKEVLVGTFQLQAFVGRVL
ncbi:hypothetical protein SAMN06295974_3751 [Plantibacter flavus]|uniref:Uncharacterized protein n=1 Tax=Plantibacter flavus TaxID=150123 RepID=A0A3N2BLE7_9MICO|nr:hypothetical protein [Plantibacter flavus]ROR76101.1 hypothetical protein EDD42_4054 [Plantibacter flavus]SMG48542.1 hypothetical protein SAMN06295974_3751 [Plantibacter flavus]